MSGAGRATYFVFNDELKGGMCLVYVCVTRAAKCAVILFFLLFLLGRVDVRDIGVCIN